MTARDVANGLSRSRAIVACSALTDRCRVHRCRVDVAATSAFASLRHIAAFSRVKVLQLAEIVDSVGDRIDVIMDGGIQRGTHVLKALSLGAKAVGVGRFYLYPLAAAGQAGVERALSLMRSEIERGMKLMGCTTIDQLSRENLRFR
jgi:isopentenyl diphosphate isomerase/L-lactate dehydrogenase-like FMN-dependent dehydrogenase